jgi:hypothetical protein
MCQPFSGTVEIQNGTGKVTIRLHGDNAALYVGAEGHEGDIIVRDVSGRDIFWVDGDKAALYVGAEGHEGDIIVRDANGRDVFRVDGGNAALCVGAKGHDGDIIVRDANGRDVFSFDGAYANLYVGAEGNEGAIIVRDDAGQVRIRLDGKTGDIRLQGADCAEDFDVDAAGMIFPGTVLVIGEDSRLRPCESPYDRRVAGVASGGCGVRPGIVLDKHPVRSDRVPVALNGKVYCSVDAQLAPINIGDLLTTSSTPGHAMKADDPFAAFGAVIGKALQPLKEGRGMIPILVSLQ